MKRILVLILCTLALTGCGVGEAVSAVAGQIKDSVQETISEKLDDVGETIDSLKSGDLGILGIVPDPNKFALGANTYTLGEATLDDLREKYHGMESADGTFVIIDQDGYIAVQADDAGVVIGLMISSGSCTVYKGIKIGKKRDDVINSLGKPAVEEGDSDGWFFPEYQTAVSITWGKEKFWSKKTAKEIAIVQIPDYS